MIKKLIINSGIYHLILTLRNVVKTPLIFFKIFFKSIFEKPYRLFNFKIKAPFRLDNNLLANFNTHFNCFGIGNYELSEKYLIEKYLDSKDSVLELGGCLGVISLITNRILHNKKKHVVLEIDSEKYKYLKHNKVTNKAEFYCCNGALSINEELFYEKGIGIWGGNATSIGTDKEKVIAYTIKDLEKKYNLVFNTLIMDIEGGELELFMTFKIKQFNKIIFENHYANDENLKIENILKSNDFNLIERVGKVEFWKKD